MATERKPPTGQLRNRRVFLLMEWKWMESAKHQQSGDAECVAESAGLNRLRPVSEPLPWRSGGGGRP